MEQHTRHATNLIEHKELELREIRRDQGGISSKLQYWKYLDDKAKRLEREIAHLKAIRAQMVVRMKA